jgi:hypothetical protein
VEQTAQPVTAPDLVHRRRLGRRRLRERRTLIERAVRTVLVVMPDLGADDLLQVAAADDQEPVEAFAPQASYAPLRMRLCSWRLHRRADHADALRAEHVVEAEAELAVAVGEEEAHRLFALRPPAVVDDENVARSAAPNASRKTSTLP